MSKLFFSKFPIRLYLCVLLPGVIIGCTSFEEKMRIKECKTRNLYKDGYNDAVNGYKESHFHIYNNRCKQYEITLDQNLYTKGYKKGITDFCTYESGYQFALKGKKYQGKEYGASCPPQKEKEFLKGYSKGDKKCLYEAGYSHANEGKTSSFPSVKCLKLSKTHSQKEYVKGRVAGLKVFCTYDKGYEFGLKAKKYLYICPKRRAKTFLKGYRAGDRKCLYEAGYNYAVNGRRRPPLSSAPCLKLSKTQSNKQYLKGWNAGLQIFCTYKTGYNLGINNYQYENICPKNLETNFFKGYTLGLQEYRVAQRQKELLAIEQQKIDMERERTRQMMAIEQQKIDTERERTQQLVDIENQRIYQRERDRKDFLNSQKQKCRYDSDCLEGGNCSYLLGLGYRICQYD